MLLQSVWEMWVMALIASGCVLVFSAPYLHFLQLESYQQRMYIKCVLRNARSQWCPLLCISLLGGLLMIMMLLRFQNTLGACAAFVMFLLGNALWAGMYYVTPQKKALVWTPRVRRLSAIMFLLTFACCALLFLIFGALDSNAFFSSLALRAAVPLTLLVMLTPVWVWAASVIAHPWEERIKDSYFQQARNILAMRDDLLRIGITGSYGKTSCKYILGSILSEKYNVLVPPGSYNTPMGVTRVVREQLRPQHEVFIAEMGARYVGDIADLCELVCPKYGLLTSIGKQHLETFKTFENIVKTKFELIESLPDDGFAFFPHDAIALPLYKKTNIYKGLYGIKEDDGVSLFMSADNIHTGPQGSEFDLVDALGQVVRCRTVLLGRHNIRNIVGCAAVARSMDMSMKEIARGIRRIQPIEHRLQIVSSDPITVIDDAFNANPAGARASLQVLAEFPGRKIVVTPGLIELGEAQYEENSGFGQAMATVADIAIIVGKYNAEAIKNGLLSKGFAQNMLYIVESFEDAMELLRTLTRPKDVVLLENDLPENYSNS